MIGTHLLVRDQVERLPNGEDFDCVHGQLNALERCGKHTEPFVDLLSHLASAEPGGSHFKVVGTPALYLSWFTCVGDIDGDMITSVSCCSGMEDIEVIV